MVRQLIDFELSQSAQKTLKPITESSPTFQVFQSTYMIDIFFLARVSVAKHHRRDPCHDVIVVDPTIMLKLNMVNISFAPNTRASKGVQLFRLTTYKRQHAASGTDFCHRAAERMPAKPEWQLVGLKRVFNVRPNLIHFSLESSVDLSDCFRQRRQRIHIGLNVIPIVDFRSSKNHNAVVFILKPIRLRPSAIKKFAVRESKFARRDITLFNRQIRNH